MASQIYFGTLRYTSYEVSLIFSLQLYTDLTDLFGDYPDLLQDRFSCNAAHILLTICLQLYTDLTDLFHDYPDLLQDFAGFLLPDQAVECDCFLSHQEFVRARTFLRKLEVISDQN